MNEHLGLVFKTKFKTEPPRPKIIIEDPIHLGLVFKTIKEEPVILSSVEEPVQLGLVFKTVRPVEPDEPVPEKIKSETLKMNPPKPLLGSIALLLAAGYFVSKR